MATAAPDALCPARLERVRAAAEQAVERGEMPNAQLRVTRHGELLHASSCGEAAPRQALRPDDIFRIYSMTKPVTAVAALVLYERGCFHLGDPVSAYLPEEFGNVRVVAGAAKPSPRPADALGLPTEPLATPLTILHLFTHTAGLHSGNIDPGARSLAEYAATAGSLPLLFQPGTQFRYGEGISVIGRLIEVWSGQAYDEFLRSEIFEPLGMTDAHFALPESKRHRLVRQYRSAGDDSGALSNDGPEPEVAGPFVFQGNGPEGYFPGPSGGLVCTCADYCAFAQMLCNGGVGANGARILGSATVELMRSNHLPAASQGQAMDCGDLMSGSIGPTNPGAGVGFGLSVSVVVDTVKCMGLKALGEYGWLGGGCTTFWVDPSNCIVVVFFSQVHGHRSRSHPPGTQHNYSDDLRVAVNAAIVDHPGGGGSGAGGSAPPRASFHRL